MEKKKKKKREEEEEEEKKVITFVRVGVGLGGTAIYKGIKTVK